MQINKKNEIKKEKAWKYKAFAQINKKENKKKQTNSISYSSRQP